MEMIQKYIDRLQYVNGGIYHIQCDEETTDEELHMIHEWWNENYENNSDYQLVITRDNIMSFTYRREFDFGTAMKLVAEGKHVTRNSNHFFYLYINSKTKQIMEQLMPLETNHPYTYVPDVDDIRATDWKLFVDQDGRAG